MSAPSTDDEGPQTRDHGAPQARDGEAPQAIVRDDPQARAVGPQAPAGEGPRTRVDGGPQARDARAPREAPADAVPADAVPADPALANVDEHAHFLALLDARGRPLVTPALVAITVAVFGVMLANGVNFLKPTAEELLPWGADYGPLTLAGQPWRLLTSAFLHFGVLHLAFNLFALWQVGGLVERLLGRVNFLALYLGAAIGGSLLSVQVHPYVVSAGASGAVFGVYGAFLAYLLRQRGTLPPELLRKLRGSTMAFVGYNLLFGLGVKAINNSAHIGGLLTGFACGWLMAGPLRRAPRRRDAAVVGALVLGLAAIVVTQRAAPGDYLAAVRHFSSVETPALERLKGALNEHRDDGARVAEILEREILPPWRGAVSRLRELHDLPDSEQKLIDQLASYADHRALAFELMAKALRTDDAADTEAARRAMERADALLVRLNTRTP
ncbi:MAG: rhomboid family intramembrane serine protease [Kofleriaceae bacterium]